MAISDLPSKETLEAVPGRVFTFLMGLAESLPARAVLMGVGFTPAEHEYSWSRLQKLGALPKRLEAIDPVVRGAIVELDAWDGPNFTAIAEALMRDHAEQAEFLFDNLEASDGPEAVPGVEKLLDRLDALESGKGRPSGAEEKDASALALLAVRGYPKEERQRLRGLVETTKRVAPAPRLGERERDEILIELYRWHSDWSAQARKSITSRATLIRLGLAARRRRKKSGSDAPVEPGLGPQEA